MLENEYGHLQRRSQRVTVCYTNGKYFLMDNGYSSEHCSLGSDGNYREIKPPVLGGKDTPFPHMYDMIRVHFRNLVTVNHLWSPIPYMECRNLVTVNDSYGPPIPYMECGNLVTVNDSYGPHTLYGIGS